MPADFLTAIILLTLLLGVLWLTLRILRPSEPVTTAATRLQLQVEGLEKQITGLHEQLATLRLDQQEAIAQLRERLVAAFGELREELRSVLGRHSEKFLKDQADALKQISALLQSAMTEVQKQVGENLVRSSDELNKRMEGLTAKTDQRLQEISKQVDKRLAEGFEKTTATFGDVLKRLALIDEAQKKITELSSDVVSLQEVLADKRSRGAFGEVQLSALVRNVLPEGHFELQHMLSNGKIVDCAIFLPQPTGMVPIDAKFPLESYRRMTDDQASSAERTDAERRFKQDIQKHIKDIAEKYILAGETSNGAVMFIPAEAVFAEIQGRHPDLVEDAQVAHVWMVSPTTLWAVLNTARAVLKDAATQEQVHIIQEHLVLLAKDFERFRKRMDDLSRHIKQAHDDVDNVNRSARKISSRFNKIERVELENEQPVTLSQIAVDDDDETT